LGGQLAEQGAETWRQQHRVTANRELALANGTGTARATWNAAADGLIDALAGPWLAPVGLLRCRVGHRPWGARDRARRPRALSVGVSGASRGR
jgi:hypothetical protein